VTRGQVWSAPGKAWERGKSCRGSGYRQKPCMRAQRVATPAWQRRPTARTECCVGRGGARARSVHRERAGRGIEPRKWRPWVPTLFQKRKAASRRCKGSGVEDPPGSESGACAHQGSTGTWEIRLLPPAVASGARGKTEAHRDGQAEVGMPHSTGEAGKPGPVGSLGREGGIGERRRRRDRWRRRRAPGTSQRNSSE
jgi:hypothetical protein